VTSGVTALLLAIYAAQLALQMLLYGEPPETRGIFAFLAPSERGHVLAMGYPPLPGGALWPGAWSYVLANFVHAGLVHLAFNLSAYAVLGRRVEALLGRGFALLLVAVGTFSLALAPLLQGGFHLGFSGVACAFLGAVLVHARVTRDEPVLQVAKHWTISLGIWSLMPGVSWAGHLAGFALGALLTAVWTAPFARALRRPRARAAAGALSLALVLASFALHLREVIPAVRYRKFPLLDALLVRLHRELDDSSADRAWTESMQRDLERIGSLPTAWQRYQSAVSQGLIELGTAGRSREERRGSYGRMRAATRPWFEEREGFRNRISDVLWVDLPRRERS
jgi:membrane associated rhomboid family serine protease